MSYITCWANKTFSVGLLSFKNLDWLLEIILGSHFAIFSWSNLDTIFSMKLLRLIGLRSTKLLTFSFFGISQVSMSNESRKLLPQKNALTILMTLSLRLLIFWNITNNINFISLVSNTRPHIGLETRFHTTVSSSNKKRHRFSLPFQLWIFFRKVKRLNYHDDLLSFTI